MKSRFIMVIELSEVVWHYTRDFKIKRVCSASLIWNHKYDFRPKLHDSKFNCHFITSILKSHNLNKNYNILVSTIVYSASSQFVKKQNHKCVYISFWKQVSIMSTWCDCIMWLVVLVYCLILIGWEKDVI